MTKIANAFQVAPTTLWERINSDDPFNPHEVGKPANLSADAMASLTADIERDDHCQRSKTPAEFGVVLDAKRNGDVFHNTLFD